MLAKYLDILCTAGPSLNWEWEYVLNWERGSLLLDVGGAAPASRREHVRPAHRPYVPIHSRQDPGAGHCERVLQPLHQSPHERISQ